MQHVDDELLTLLALQFEEPEDVTARHLASCARCQAELDALRRVVASGRAAPTQSELLDPPARVWDNISAALGVQSGSEDTGPEAYGADESSSRPVPPVGAPSTSRQSRQAFPTDTSKAQTPPAAGSTAAEEVRPARRSRRVPTWLAVAAAFVVGALGAGAVVSVVGDDDEPPTPTTSQLADAELEPLGGAGTAGSAAVLADDGHRLLEVQIDDRTPGEGYREVWLLDADATRLVSLGVLTGTEGRLDIPDDLDLADYPVVDVSREPLDGDPTHSGDSIARGTLGL